MCFVFLFRFFIRTALIRPRPFALHNHNTEYKVDVRCGDSYRVTLLRIANDKFTREKCDFFMSSHNWYRQQTAIETDRERERDRVKLHDTQIDWKHWSDRTRAQLHDNDTHTHIDIIRAWCLTSDEKANRMEELYSTGQSCRVMVRTTHAVQRTHNIIVINRFGLDFSTYADTQTHTNSTDAFHCYRLYLPVHVHTLFNGRPFIIFYLWHCVGHSILSILFLALVHVRVFIIVRCHIVHSHNFVISIVKTKICVPFVSP